MLQRFRALISVTITRMFAKDDRDDRAHQNGRLGANRVKASCEAEHLRK